VLKLWGILNINISKSKNHQPDNTTGMSLIEINDHFTENQMTALLE